LEGDEEEGGGRETGRRGPKEKARGKGTERETESEKEKEKEKEFLCPF